MVDDAQRPVAQILKNTSFPKSLSLPIKVI